jgi:hypothetical protein
MFYKIWKLEECQIGTVQRSIWLMKIQTLPKNESAQLSIRGSVRGSCSVFAD